MTERYFKIDGRYALSWNELVEMIKKGYCNRGEYYCRKCNKHHKAWSGIGKEHVEYLTQFECKCDSSAYCEYKDYEPIKKAKHRREVLNNFETVYWIAEKFRILMGLLDDEINAYLAWKKCDSEPVIHNSKIEVYSFFRAKVKVKVVEIESVDVRADVRAKYNYINDLDEEDMRRLEYEINDRSLLEKFNDPKVHEEIERMMPYFELVVDK